MMPKNMMAPRVRSAGSLVALLVIAGLAGCVPAPQAPRPQPQAPLPPPPPPPAPPPKVAPAPVLEWDVAPVSPGDWSYKAEPLGPIARFGPSNGQTLLSLRCDPRSRVITISWLGPAAPSATMTIRTSAGDLAWPGRGTTAGLGALVVQRAASDPGFDWMIFSRGRFSLEIKSGARLIVPAWAEVARVVEDCRG